MPDEHLLAQAADQLRRSRLTVAMTGAGVSVESGLPDFRSPGGIWSRYDIREYAYIENFLRNPRKVWQFIDELIRDYGDAQPNEGHRALARLEAAGKLEAVITQNIDNLHQAGGSEQVIEFHGNMHRLVCLDCRQFYSIRDAGVMAHTPPQCRCGRILKPDFVFFGEMIPPQALEESFRLASRCDVLLVAGTSAEVSPASMIPVEAKQGGAMLIELNLSPTMLTDHLTDIFLQGPFAEVMPRLTAAVLADHA
ncbi:MAG: NAD-dependent deacylase [Acidobacteria bacterium]|nr:NAD-dependent deacylase [Acidobacteriota bacterium]